MTWMKLRRLLTEVQLLELVCTLLWKLSHYNWISVQIGTLLSCSRKGLLRYKYTKITSFYELQLDFKLCNFGEEEKMFTGAFDIS